MVRIHILAASAIGLAATFPAFAQTAAAPGAASAQAQPPIPATRVDVIKALDARFTKIDANSDGSLTTSELQTLENEVIAAQKAEINQIVERGFAKLDTNKDGRLSIDEYRAAAPVIDAKPAENAAELVKVLDTDKNGKISGDEFRRRTLSAFDALDGNKDGRVTPEERRKAGAGGSSR